MNYYGDTWDDSELSEDYWISQELIEDIEIDDIITISAYSHQNKLADYSIDD